MPEQPHHAHGSPSETRAPIARTALLGLVALKLSLHLFSSAWVAYGWVGDELYFLDCARQLAWGYVDHPPLSIAMLRIWTAVLGESMLAVRLLAAIAGSATIVFAGLIARELGGGWLAQGLAGFGVLAGPIYLGMSGYYSMNPIDQALSALAACLLLRLIHEDRRRTWLVLGVVLGLGLLNKLSFVWLGCGILAGILLTPHRRWLLTAGPWLAGAIALAMLAPYLVWQAQHAWPVLEFMRNAALEKNVPAPPLVFLGRQILALHPATLPFWLTGVLYLMFAPSARPHRLLGWVWLTVLLILLASGTARTYYLAPVSTIAIAAAGRAVEHFAARPSLRFLPAAATALLVLAFGTGAPMAIPLLSPERYVAYERSLGLKPPVEAREQQSELPLHFALRFHGPPLARAVDSVYESLPAGERERAVVLTDSFHEAGAINVLGPALGLPRGIGIHNNYWLWGPGPADRNVFLVVTPNDSTLLTVFASVEHAAEIECDWCMPFLRAKSVYLCRDPHRPLVELWPELKKFI